MEHRITFDDVAERVTQLFKCKGETWEETYLQGVCPFKRSISMVVNKALRLEGRVLAKGQNYSDKHVADSLVDLCVWTLMAIHIGELEKQKEKESLTKEIPLEEVQ